MSVKQVIVVRKDLNMRKGKMIAQGAHASLKVFLDREDRSIGFKNIFKFDITEEMKEWIYGDCTKIVCGVDSKEELLDISMKADDLGIPNSLIKDKGYTEVEEGTYTACAVGPDKVEKVDKVTGSLDLL